MHSTSEAIAAAEWGTLYMALRAVFGRANYESPDLAEIRISVTAEAVPGLGVIEYEFVGSDGLAFAGGRV